MTKGDEPLTIKWYKDNHEISSSSDFLINNMDSKLSILLLRRVTAKHTGTYACKAYNPAGSALFSAQLNVKGKKFRVML